MALIKKTSIEDVVAAADMVDVVQGRTQLRKSGARWVGLCPFHSEKTPSFGINPVEKLFYCHGCHKGGDLITFIRETEGLDFAQAVEWLADRTGTQLEYEETSPAQEARRKHRDRLESLLEDAASFYSRYLWDTAAGELARGYLAERGLTEEVCRDFRLGLSPGGEQLAGKARAKGYSQEELVAAGLVNRRGNDYYAGRLVFPLSNARGRVLGFGARRLHDDDPIKAKYVNSPEGELFRKSRIVYGLHRARATIAKQDEAVVVEGYTDVLALHQRGRGTVVASMGTALTEEQLKELGHLTKRLFLCFDADAAGEAATLRGMDLAAARGFQVRVVALPPGVDPADAADSFDERLQGAVGYLRHRAEAGSRRAARGRSSSCEYKRPCRDCQIRPTEKTRFGGPQTNWGSPQICRPGWRLVRSGRPAPCPTVRSREATGSKSASSLRWPPTRSSWSTIWRPWTIAISTTRCTSDCALSFAARPRPTTSSCRPGPSSTRPPRPSTSTRTRPRSSSSASRSAWSAVSWRGSREKTLPEPSSCRRS